MTMENIRAGTKFDVQVDGQKVLFCTCSIGIDSDAKWTCCFTLYCGEVLEFLLMVSHEIEDFKYIWNRFGRGGCNHKNSFEGFNFQQLVLCDGLKKLRRAQNSKVKIKAWLKQYPQNSIRLHPSHKGNNINCYGSTNVCALLCARQATKANNNNNNSFLVATCKCGQQLFLSSKFCSLLDWENSRNQIPGNMFLYLTSLNFLNVLNICCGAVLTPLLWYSWGGGGGPRGSDRTRALSGAQTQYWSQWRWQQQGTTRTADRESSPTSIPCSAL